MNEPSANFYMSKFVYDTVVSFDQGRIMWHADRKRTLRERHVDITVRQYSSPRKHVQKSLHL